MPRRRVALAALLVGPFMGVLDAFVVIVALPAVRADLGASYGETQLVVAAYAVTYAVGLITGARLGDLYGRRRVYVVGMAGFVATSVACALAGDPAVLIGARVAQGVTAAAMLPQAYSIIRASFPGPHQSAAVGWYGTVIGLGAVLGPVVAGGLLGADWGGLGWRLIFLVNVPAGVAALLAALVVVPESRTSAAPRLDLPGAALSAVWLTALLIPLTQGTEAGWPTWMVGSLAVSPLLMAAWVRYERGVSGNGGTPILPTRLFRSRRFASGIAIIAVLYAAGGGPLLFLVSYYLQEGLRLSPMRSGVLCMPLGLGYALGSGAAPRLLRRGGAWAPVSGVVVAVLSLAGMATVGVGAARADPLLLLLPLLFTMGAGHGLAINATTNLVISSVSRDDAGAASGILLTSTQVAVAFGVATIGSLFLGLLTPAEDTPSAASFAHALGWSVLVLAALKVTSLPLFTAFRGGGR